MLFILFVVIVFGYTNFNPLVIKSPDCYTMGGGCTKDYIYPTHIKRIQCSFAKPPAIGTSCVTEYIPAYFHWIFIVILVGAYILSSFTVMIYNKFETEIKEFLKPNRIKIILFVIFAGLPVSLIGLFLFYSQPIKFIIFETLFLLLTYMLFCFCEIIYKRLKG